MDTRLQNVVPPEGTCAGKATLVDASGDPIGYHLSEALRLLGDTGEQGDEAHDHVAAALDVWDRDRRGE